PASHSASPARSLPCCLSSRTHHRHLHSFPTRRSSDLAPAALGLTPYGTGHEVASGSPTTTPAPEAPLVPLGVAVRQGDFWRLWRSEEHTSELQSLTNLVCRLQLEQDETAIKAAPRQAI